MVVSYFGTLGYSANQKWFQEMIDACVNTKGVTCGVYSSHDSYKWIFGEPNFNFSTYLFLHYFTQLILAQNAGSTSYTYPSAAQLPVWYKPDGSKTVTPDNFDDFEPFGGYTSPYAKQYFYAYGTCGVTYLYEDWVPFW